MSILNTAPKAIQGAASSTRSSIMDLGVQALKFINTLRREEYELVGSALDRIGLQRRESSLRPVAWLAAGAVIGGSAVLLFSPASVETLRRGVASFFAAAKKGETANAPANGLREVERDAADSVGRGVDALEAEAPRDNAASNGHS